jgi:hypothetical protein
MEEDPIPGWNEMAKIPKEREEHITNDLTQQAGMVDPNPSQRRTPTKNPPPVDARRGRAQCRKPVSAAPSGYLPQSGEKTEGDDTPTSPKRPKKIKLEKQGDENKSGRVVERSPPREETNPVDTPSLCP